MICTKPAHTFSIDTYLPWINQISLQALHPGCGVCPSLTALTELSMIHPPWLLA